jgi:hypothetical protein
MKIPNLASSNHAGTGRLSIEFQSAEYVFCEKLLEIFKSKRVKKRKVAFFILTIFFDK